MGQHFGFVLKSVDNVDISKVILIAKQGSHRAKPFSAFFQLPCGQGSWGCLRGDAKGVSPEQVNQTEQRGIPDYVTS